MPETDSIPLIAITTSLPKGVTAVEMRTICDAVLFKPVSIQELMRTIDRTIGDRVRPDVNVGPDTR
jgi:CheY-like chemotaxis protein